MAFLQPQHALGLDAKGADVELAPGVQHRFPDMAAIAGWAMDLIGQLTGEADAQQPARHAGHGHLARVQVGERLVRHVAIGQAAQYVAGARPGQVERGVDLRHVDGVDALSPARLEPPLNPLKDGSGAGRSSRHVPLRFGHAGGHAVVEDDALVVAHDAIAHAAGGQIAPAVDVQPVEQIGHAGAGQAELAQRADVDKADALAHGADFGCRVAVMLRPQPQPGDH